MIVGAARNLPVDTLRPWAASARKVSTGPIFLLCDIPANYRALTTDYGVELVYAGPLNAPGGVCQVARTRWKALRQLLTTTRQHGSPSAATQPVVFADTRDVIFQSDPTTAIDGKLLLGSEGKTHRENPWVQGWLNELAPEWNDRLLDADVLNAGVIGGPAQLLEAFANQLTKDIPVTPCDCTLGATHMTDQTFVNILARDTFARDVQITTDWVFHVRSVEHQRIPVTWHAETHQLLRADGVPFPIIHQYDVVEQLASLQEMR